MPLSGHPLRGSGRAGLPHPALALGNDAKSMQWIRMMDTCRRNMASDQASHALPGDASALATPRQGALPKPAHLESEQSQRGAVHGDTIVTAVSLHNRAQPLANLRNRIVHSPSQLGLDLGQLRRQPLPHGLAQDREVLPVPFLRADVRKAEKVERLRFVQSTLLPVEGSPRAKLNQPRFLWMQFQSELGKSLSQGGQELLRLGTMLESNDEIIRIWPTAGSCCRLALYLCLYTFGLRPPARRRSAIYG